MIAWHVRLAFTGSVATHELDAAASSMADHSPILTVQQDGAGGSIALFVDAERATGATTIALDLASDLLAGRDVTAIETQTESAFMASLDAPAYPEVVGYAEIAEMAGLTRQRIRQLAGTKGFPAPIVETAQGPLMPKAAAQHWVETRHARSGRPRKVAV